MRINHGKIDTLTDNIYLFISQRVSNIGDCPHVQIQAEGDTQIYQYDFAEKELPNITIS